MLSPIETIAVARETPELAGTDDVIPEPTTVGSQFTVERSLYVIVIVLAGVLRLSQLGEAPLAPLEAATAWRNWLSVQGFPTQHAPIGSSALYGSIQTLLFWLGATNDAAARIPAAIVGTLLCCLPWWWRPLIGKSAALLVAILLAIDPWLLAYSRYGDGAILSITLGAVFFTDCVHAAREHRTLVVPLPSGNNDATGNHKDSPSTSTSAESQTRHMPVPAANVTSRRNHSVRLASVAFGLMVVSGPLAWNLLIPLLVSVFIVNPRILSRLFQDSENILLMVAAAVTGATLWFARLSALGEVSHSLTLWLVQFQSGQQANRASEFDTVSYFPSLLAVEQSGVGWLVLRLLADQPLLTFFCLVGLMLLVLGAIRIDSVGVRTGRTVARLLAVWWFWALMVALLPGRSGFVLGLLFIPMVGTTVVAVTSIWDMRPRTVDPREVLTVGLVMLVLTISFCFWVTAFVSQTQFDGTILLAAMTILIVVLILLVLFGIWSGPRPALWLALGLVAIVSMVMQLSASWKVSFEHIAAYPDGLFVQITNPEIRLLQADLQTLSAQRTGDPTALPVQVQTGTFIPAVDGDGEYVPGPDPLLGWYLRDMQRLSWVQSPRLDRESNIAAAIITLGPRGQEAGTGLDIATDFVGSNYQTNGVWRPNFFATRSGSVSAESVSQLVEGIKSQLWPQNIQPLLRWLWYREAAAAAKFNEVVLWTKPDAVSDTGEP